MSRVVTSFCGMPAFGSFGTPIGYYGGSSGSSVDDGTTMDVTNLPGRALTTPGTTIPPVGMTSARAPFFLALKGATRFDAAASVYALPRHANTGQVSLSFWLGKDFGDPWQGAMFRLGDWDDIANNALHPQYFVIGFTNAVIGGSSRPALVVFGDTEPGPGFTVTMNCFFQFDLSPALGAFDPIGQMQGWAHVMVSVDTSGQTATAFVNDTSLGTNIGPSGMGSVAGVIPFAHADTIDCDTGLKGYNCIGGDFDIPGFWNPRGTGLQACVTEYWLDVGTFIDWSSSANRQLFHTSDLAGLSWAPVNLGAHGELPLGGGSARPTMYNTGGPDTFPLNRATGRANAVYHDSSFAGGFENRLPICDNSVPQ